MAAAGLPVVQVLLDDVNNGGTFPYDITRYVRLTEGYTISTRGRSDESSQPSPVTLTLALDNSDGRFTLGAPPTGYGVINVDRGIRVRVTANGVTTIRFTGFVQAWPTEWPDGTDRFSVVKVTATDALTRPPRRTLRSVVEEEVMLAGPAWYYTMGDPEGSVQAVDSSGNQAPPLVAYSLFSSVTSIPIFGSATGPSTDGLTAVLMDAGAKYLQVNDFPGLEWVVCCFNTTSTGGSLIDASSQSLAPYLGLSGVGQLVLSAAGATNTSIATGTLVNDGATHVACVSLDRAAGTMSLYLDGALVGTTTGTIPANSGLGRMRVGYNFTGTMAHVAGGMGPLSAGRALYISAAMLNGFYQRSDVALQRIAAYEPTAVPGTFDIGQTDIPFVDSTGKTVADLLQAVATAEQGVVYVDGSGYLTFHSRARSPQKVTPDLTLDAGTDILDPGTTVQGDMQQVVNYGTGNRIVTGGEAVTQIVSDAASQQLHGRYPGGGEYQVATDAEVVDRLSWLVKTHSKPVPRIPDLVLDLLTADASVQAAVMALDVDSRIAITGMPSQSALGSYADLSVLGYAETLNATTWQWTANTLSWPAYEQAWVLGDANYGQLDNTARLGV